MSLFKKSNKSSKFKLGKIPIALHFYSAFTIIIVFIFASIYITFNTTNKALIRSECETRINSAVKSSLSFADAFKESADLINYDSPEDLRDAMSKKIAESTDISNEASIVLFCEAPFSSDRDYLILWPSIGHSQMSTLESANLVLNGILEDRKIVTDKNVREITLEGNTYFYRFLPIEYEVSFSGDKDVYYLLFYVNSNNYVNYTNKIYSKLFNTMLIAIVISGILSIIVSYPIISSTRKLARFSKRIGKGNFTPYKTRIASRELYDLSDTMNQMAYRLSESDKEQKTFFQNASHELRTPLMSIQGYAEGIKYGIFDSEHQNEAVDIIIDETNRLSDMVENLLTISKMDLSASNNYEVRKNIVNVYELVGITIEKVRGGFILNNKELINKININDQVHIYANENDVFRMLENVFSNCLRYANKEVTFSCYTKDKNIIFEIYDDGPGISDEVMSHLFDRFAKGGDGKHGIGLALVKAIVKEHEGTIEASNRVEGGALFKITIPVISSSSQLTLINKNN